MAHRQARKVALLLAAFCFLGGCSASKLLVSKMPIDGSAALIKGWVPNSKIPRVEQNSDADGKDWLAWPRRLADQAGPAATTTFAFVPQYLPGGDQRRVAGVPTKAPTKKPTTKPTPKPTAKPTPKPTAKKAPTPKPTVKKAPTPKPTVKKAPTSKPTAKKAPTPKPTAKKVPTAAASTTAARTTGTTPSSGQWSATNPQAVTAGTAPSNTTSALVPWLHNQYRLRHQNTPALKWNATLAASSQAWANKCIFQHSGTPGVGENLYFALYWQNQPHLLSDGWASAIFGFYKEISSYDYSNPGFQEAAGHFTALVWASTTTVGCASANCPAPPGYTGVDAVEYVCQYYTAGNVATTDYFKANVLPLV